MKSKESHNGKCSNVLFKILNVHIDGRDNFDQSTLRLKIFVVENFVIFVS